ncbi:MAG: hypothetical protein A3E84_02490 [Gammaproteobacteria bacterium RIFCSPHIGHO2_12_FULL_42_13]|nr:MAG: hypothetical protein A3E84_02490 [Gammaproteobacteria bacterium RIFCSPHIGHO2_12_FULL_42_13]
MDTITFFEQVAGYAHHREEVRDLINGQPEEIKQNFLKNDFSLLREQLGDEAYLANTTKVVQFNDDFHRVTLIKSE